jgi:hypothetical protein
MKIQMIFVNKMSSPSNDEIVQSRLTGEWLLLILDIVGVEVN